MNIALVDDRREDLERLRDTLNRYAALNGLKLQLSCFSSGEDLMADFRAHQYTMIFLDVFMEALSGIETAERIRSMDGDVCLVFVTASNEHQAQAIHWHVYDYLNKEDGDDAVFRVMDQYLRLHTEAGKRYFTFGSDRTATSIPYDQIVYLTADRNYLTIHDRRGLPHRIRMTFSAARKQLEPDGRFLMILRGVMVNMDYITDVSDGSCCLLGKTRLPVSLRNCDRIEEIWTNYTFARIRRENLMGGD